MEDKVATIADLGGLFGRVTGMVLALAGIVLFIFLLIGGFRFITSGGDPKAVDSAKKTITYAVGGLVVMLLSYLFLLIIRQVTGVDVTKFNILLQPSP